MSQKLKEAIFLTAEYFRTPLSDAVLLMYAEDLQDLPEEKVISAYHDFRRNPKNRTNPLPAQIRELVCPQENISIESRAREIAARISAAIPKFGWSNAKDARDFIGEEGWQLVQRQGGWRYICENHGLSINPSAFQAQVRDQAEGQLRYGAHAIESAIRVLPSGEKRNFELVSGGDILKNLVAEPIKGNK